MRGHSMLSAACCPDMLDFPLLSALGSSTTHLLLAFGVGLTLPYWVNLHDNRYRAVLLLATFALAMRYMWWRGTETLAPAGLTFDMLASYSLFAFELLAMVGTVSSYVIMSRIRLRSQEADTHAHWWGEDEPRVAILIATYNKDLDILERTIVGARALRHRNKEVLALDDSRRDWLRDYCAGQGVRYMRRPDNKGSKAGNINHCLDRLAEDPIPPDFIAVLDADFVPHRGVALPLNLANGACHAPGDIPSGSFLRPSPALPPLHCCHQTTTAADPAPACQCSPGSGPAQPHQRDRA